jgi:hypothetical protein
MGFSLKAQSFATYLQPLYNPKGFLWIVHSRQFSTGDAVRCAACTSALAMSR